MLRHNGVTYCTIAEAAEKLEVSAGRVYQFVSDGRLTVSDIVGRMMVRLVDVRTFARSRRKKPGPVPAE